MENYLMIFHSIVNNMKKNSQQMLPHNHLTTKQRNWLHLDYNKYMNKQRNVTLFLSCDHNKCYGFTNCFLVIFIWSDVDVYIGIITTRHQFTKYSTFILADSIGFNVVCYCFDWFNFILLFPDFYFPRRG